MNKETKSLLALLYGGVMLIILLVILFGGK